MSVFLTTVSLYLLYKLLTALPIKREEVDVSRLNTQAEGQLPEAGCPPGLCVTVSVLYPCTAQHRGREPPAPGGPSVRLVRLGD